MKNHQPRLRVVACVVAFLQNPVNQAVLPARGLCLLIRRLGIIPSPGMSGQQHELSWGICMTLSQVDQRCNG